MTDRIQENIDFFYENVNTIPVDKKYWLIRTNSGELYDTFLSRSYVAIGYNEISLKQVAEIKSSNVEHVDIIRKVKNLVVDTYGEEEKRPGLVANQIYNFTYNLKKGDVVVIPSKDSNFVSFGEVQETPLMEFDANRVDGCDFYRRKRIKWIKTIKRNELEPLLFKMFFSHNALNDITNYGNLIEATLNNYFIRDEEEHVIFNIQTNDDIGALDLFQLGFYLLKFTKDFYINYGIELDVADFDVKVNLNSKGKLKFKTKFGKGAIVLALISIAVNGGGVRLNYNKIDLDISTDGLIQKIIDYQNNKFDRTMLKEIHDSMDSLQVKEPEDALEIYRQFSINKRSE